MEPEVLLVDRIRCDAHGICAGLLPEMIRLDDWGYPIVDPRPVPSNLLAHARRAVRDCPVQALRLQRRRAELAATASRSTSLSRL